MIALLVKAGTDVKVIAPNTEWLGQNFEDQRTTEDQMFFAEDIEIDPLGHVNLGPQHDHVVGGAWAKAGWYGFLLRPQDQRGRPRQIADAKTHPVMMVPFSAVEAH